MISGKKLRKIWVKNHAEMVKNGDMPNEDIIWDNVAKDINSNINGIKNSTKGHKGNCGVFADEYNSTGKCTCNNKKILKVKYNPGIEYGD